MTLAIATIADSISDLDVNGVRILDMDQIKAGVNERDCPVLFPEPLGFISDFTVERDSQGIPSQARKTARYNLNYTFCYAPVGTGRELEKYGDMVEKVFAILDEVILHDTITGLVDIEPDAVIEFGPVPDPAGNQFLGCRLRFRVMEFIN